MSAAAQPIVRERKATIRLQVNGESRSIELDGRTTLLDALREYLNLSGTKTDCDHGQCGACTVHVAGRNVLASLTLAAATQGSDTVTVKGLDHDGTLQCMQDAFIECDAPRCARCGPGHVMSPNGDPCRCGAYPQIRTPMEGARMKPGLASGNVRR